MFDYETSKLVHRHGDDWVPMTEAAGHGGAAERDPERSWLRGHVRVFRCSRCAEEIAIEMPSREVEPSGPEAG